jgi:hypothetical protein
VRWALFVVILVAGVGGVGYAFMRARASQSEAAARADLPPGTVTADEIVDIYATNAVAADEQYKHLGPAGHPVVGTVDRVAKDDAGAAWVYFRTSHGELPATFKSTIGLASLTPNSQATVVCDVTHRLRDGSPALLGCELQSAH